ncbi:hypothetical protein ACFSJS_20335 [Streptomyces desertarenae]|uniref:Small hydrophilic protein n=1 Tax=Streptomyces desertarenae TaxID=2666184 RepID=A0ABW4PP22_9ACTN
MGKRKKDERRQQHDSGLSARSGEEPRSTAEARPAAPASPADVARKHRRRFGHN